MARDSFKENKDVQVTTQSRRRAKNFDKIQYKGRSNIRGLAEVGAPGYRHIQVRSHRAHTVVCSPALDRMPFTPFGLLGLPKSRKIPVTASFLVD
jgi:hypothetical protein